MEIAKRLTPTTTVARDLYLCSGNRCAYPGCNQPLMTSDGILVGEIAHIEAALPDGPRFRSNMTNEDRRDFANLILICANHHTVIDSDVKRWTVERLKELKKSHEAVYTGVVDRLRSTVGDVTEGTIWRSPENLGKLLDLNSFTKEEIGESVKVVEGLAKRLSALPVGARSVLALIVSRGDPRGGFSEEAYVAIPVPLLEQIVDCSKVELRDHLAILEHAAFVSYDEGFHDEIPHYKASNSTQGIGWGIFAELHELANGDAATVRQVLLDLHFTVFDS